MKSQRVTPLADVVDLARQNSATLRLFVCLCRLEHIKEEWYFEETELRTTLGFKSSLTEHGASASPNWLMWRKENRSILKNPTPFLKQVCFGCTQRLADNDESVIKSMTDLFRRITTSHVGDGDDPRNHHQKWSLCVLTWKEMPKHASEGAVSWAIKTFSQLSQVETPYSDYHQMSLEEFEVIGSLAPVCAQIVIKCL